MMPMVGQDPILDAATIEWEPHMGTPIVEPEHLSALLHEQYRAVASVQEGPSSNVNPAPEYGRAGSRRVTGINFQKWLLQPFATKLITSSSDITFRRVRGERRESGSREDRPRCGRHASSQTPVHRGGGQCTDVGTGLLPTLRRRERASNSRSLRRGKLLPAGEGPEVDQGGREGPVPSHAGPVVRIPLLHQRAPRHNWPVGRLGRRSVRANAIVGDSGVPGATGCKKRASIAFKTPWPSFLLACLPCG
jgi:hypothetical protein